MRDIAHTLAHHNKKNIIEDLQNANLDKISSNNLKKNEKNQNLQTQFLVLQEKTASQKINHKIIIDLIYFGGYSVENIAKEFNLSVENTKNIIKIALNQLKENNK
jgi:DNA-directed RNA polymerase specialized sigma24 family protein